MNGFVDLSGRQDAIRTASNRLADEILPAGLSALEYRIILFVFNKTIGEGIPCARLTGDEISDAIGVDRANAARMVCRLLRKGFVYRVGGSRGAIGISCLINGLEGHWPLSGREENTGIRTCGYIYMMANPAMPGVFKVGMTRRLPQDRAEELSKSTSSPAPFEVVHSVHFIDPASAEKLVHELLSEFRVSSNREFFRITPEQFLAATSAAAEGGKA